MAMDAGVLSKSIINAMTKGKGISSDDKAQMAKSWFTICDEIIKHIQTYGKVTAVTPVVEDDPSRNGNYQGYDGSDYNNQPVSIQIFTIS
jgi:hypothetical protein